MQEKEKIIPTLPKISNDYRCPISHLIMFDPVITQSGKTYEREEIENWLKNNDTDPLTCEKLTNKNLIPNQSLKNIIFDFLKENPTLWETEEVYFSKKLVEQLISAINEGNANDIKVYLSKDIRLLKKSLKDGKNVLVLACEQKSPKVLQIVLGSVQKKILELPCVYEDGGIKLFKTIIQQSGIVGAKLWVKDLNWGSSDIQKLFQLSLRENDLTLANISLQLGANINQSFLNDLTPIEFSYQQKNKEMVKILVQNGANIQKKDKNGNDLLLQTISNGDRELALFLLNEANDKFDVNAKNMLGETALIIAIKKGVGQLGIIYPLLKEIKIDINQSDLKGNTALHYAVDINYCVADLLEKGANVNQENIEGKTPLEIAYLRKHEDSIKALIQKGANIEKQDKEGSNLLLQAIKAKKISLSLFLLKESPILPSINIKNKLGETPLIIAIRDGQQEIIDALLSYPNIEVEQDDANRNTALHYAVELGNQSLITALLGKSNRIKLRNGEEKTPIDIAREKDNQKILDWINQEHQRIKVEPFLKPLQIKIEEQQQEIIRHKKVFQILGNHAGFFSPKAKMRFSLYHQTLQEHTEQVICVAKLRNGNLVTGSADNTLKIWNLKTNSCQKTLEGHTSWVHCVRQLQDGRLISASPDSTLKVWNLETGASEKTLQDTNQVYSVIQLRDGRLVSGGMDKVLKIWDLETGNCEQTLTGHENNIWCIIELLNGDLVSGSWDNTLKIWSKLGKKYVMATSLVGHTDQVFCIAELQDGRLVSGSKDKTCKLWNLQTRSCEKTWESHSDLVYSVIQLRDGRLMSVGNDRTLKVWNLEAGNCDQTLLAHTDIVRGIIELDDGRLVSVSGDKTIKIWDRDDKVQYEQLTEELRKDLPECKVM